jgi:dipeptidyl aminopeptidase/acylaminoacyl peptidase
MKGHTALAKATFAAAPLVIRITFGADGRVSGLHVAPGDTAAGWTPPPYARPDTFEEREVMVGKLPGTLTMPKGAKHVPVIVLVHGSGPNDRDETIGALKPFKDLAQGLGSRGIAVLRYEKRTHVDPTGVRTQKQEVDEAAHAAVALVAALPEIDPERVALLGHSQGGYLAPRIAHQDKAIKRLVILAGSTRSLENAMLAQVKYLATLSPGAASDDAIKQVETFRDTVQDPKLSPDADVAVPFGSKIPGAYFLEVRGYRPEWLAARLDIPVLVLQGERDYQVTVHEDFDVWKEALANVKTATLKTYPGLNHAFTHGEGPPSPADYQVAGHVDTAVIEDIATWLAK